MKCHGFSAIAVILALAYILILGIPVWAGEPQRPNVDKMFSAENESKIQSLVSLGIEEVFDRLMNADFMVNRDLTYKAIYSAYTNRRIQAISFARRYLTLPLIEFVDGRRISHVRDFNTAKKIFEVFPDEATPILVTLYNKSDEIVRGNIIRAIGEVSGRHQIKNLLVKALDDKSFADEETPELLGDPLRVCDIAYNQLVFRYSIRNVLRTISPSHKIEIRDYHINKLKDLL